MKLKDELKNKDKWNEYEVIKYAVYWGKNGRKYVFDVNKKVSEKALNMDIEQICDGVAWLY